MVMKVQPKAEVHKLVNQLKNGMDQLIQYPMDKNILIEELLENNSDLNEEYKVKLVSNHSYKGLVHSVKVDCSLFEKVNMKLKDWNKTDS